MSGSVKVDHEYIYIYVKGGYLLKKLSIGASWVGEYNRVNVV